MNNTSIVSEIISETLLWGTTCCSDGACLSLSTSNCAVSPTSNVTPAYQLAYHPNIHSQWWSESLSEKTVSDIQSSMASRKIKDIPHLMPNQYGQMLFYCESRDDYEFLVKAIVHRREVEPTFSALDMQQ